MFRPPSDAAVAAIVLVLLLVVYHVNGAFEYVRDAEGSVFLPLSILGEGNLSFTPSEAPFMFSWQTRGPDGRLRQTVPPWSDRAGAAAFQERYRSGQVTLIGPNYNLVPSIRIDPATKERLYINSFGVGAGLAALPVFSVLYLAKGDLEDDPRLLWSAAKFDASLLVAASASLIYLAARYFVPWRSALAIAVAYGLGTCVWSTSSQTLWQHASNEFFLALGCFLLCGHRTQPTRARAFWCGVAFGCAAVCRPTSALAGVIVGLYLIASTPRALLPYAAGMLPFAVALGAYNTYYLGSPFDFGQTQIGAQLALQKTGHPGVWQTPVWLGMLGLLLSPSRGLLVFSPFLLFAVGGMWESFRRAEFTALRPLSIACVVILLVEARHFDWWGGWSYGYRHIVDTVVFLALLLVPAMNWIGKRRWRAATFCVLLAWSIAVQFIGAFAYDVYGWNARLGGYLVRIPGQASPVTVGPDEAKQLVASQGAAVVRELRLDIDRPEYRDRLWSWRDNEIGYYVTHFMESRRAKLEAAARVGK